MSKIVMLWSSFGILPTLAAICQEKISKIRTPLLIDFIFLLMIIGFSIFKIIVISIWTDIKPFEKPSDPKFLENMLSTFMIQHHGNSGKD